jgi:hypothetical protein
MLGLRCGARKRLRAAVEREEAKRASAEAQGLERCRVEVISERDLGGGGA